MKYGVGIVSNLPLPQVVEQVKLAEKLGYESVWLIDSQLTCRELYVTLTACALATSRIKLAAGVTAPRTRHVSVAAGAFATLNDIAPGRMILGMSVGNTLVNSIGAKRSTIASLEEYTVNVKGLLGGGEVEFGNGVKNGITYLDQPTGIPVYFAVSGPRITKSAGRVADGVLLHYGAVPSQVKEGMDLVGEGESEAGRESGVVKRAVWVITSVAKDGAVARSHVQGRVLTMLHMVDKSRFSEEERDAIAVFKRDYNFASLGGAEMPPVPGLDPFIDRFAVAGDAGEVKEKVAALADMTGIEEVVITLPGSGGPYPSFEQIVEDFAEAVFGG